MGKLFNENWHISGGLRIEYTDQGYKLQFPIGEPKPEGKQKYIDFLPSFNIKYVSNKIYNYRFSYFRAINRPGFLEIVPYITIYEDYTERGNPDLKHTNADNFDIRWEVFPNQTDQVMVGVFYKRLANPIEYALVPLDNHMNLYYMPKNFGVANNYGIEIDLIKYIRVIGVKANYTWTNSSIATDKVLRTLDSLGNAKTIVVEQIRPLYGQAEHVANISLIYKSTTSGIDAQLSFSYTGKRISMISAFLDNDFIQEPYFQMDASFEKRITKSINVFVKIQNLLDSKVNVYINKTNPINYDVPYQDIHSAKTFVRQDFSGRFFLLGIRYNKNSY